MCGCLVVGGFGLESGNRKLDRSSKLESRLADHTNQAGVGNPVRDLGLDEFQF